MALTDYKISSADLVNKGVVGLPDTPALNTTQMQEKFDEIATDVIIPKYNGLVDAIITIDPAGKMEEENPTGTGTFAMNPVEEAHLGDCSTTLGDSCEASGEKSLAGGYHSSTEHDVAFVYGDHVESTSDNCAVFGSYNAAVEGDLFEIGDGSYGSPSNAFGVHSNGDVYAKGDFTNGSGDKLSEKQETLVSGTNIKTINNESLLGSGDISLLASAEWGDISGTLSDQTDLATALGGKMETANPTGTGTLSLNRTANTTVGQYSVAVGFSCEASGDYSFAEGRFNRASGQDSHAEGATSIASGAESHAEGGGGEASGQCSHVEGASCKASKIASHAEGFFTKSSSDYQHVEGKYNVEDSSDVYAHIIGNGTSDSNRSNAFTVDWNGNVEAAGEITDGNGITLSDLLPTDTASGNPCVITDAFGGKAKSLSLDIEPIQSGSGTPSPDNVCPISGISSATITRTGKNLFDGSQTISNIYGDSSGKYVYSAIGSYIVPIKGGETYTISTPNAQTIFTSTSADYPAVGVDIVDAYSGSSGLSVLKKTISTSPSANYLVFHFGGLPNYNNVQVELGSTNTPYEPYNGQTITRTYGQTVYGGSDDVTGSGATVTWAGVSDMSTISFVPNVSPNAFNGTLPSKAVSQTMNAICSRYPIYSSDTLINHDYGFAISYSGEVVYIKDKDCSTVNELLAVLSGETMAYPLATPTSISLASQNIDLLHGDNVITTNAKTVNASYKADVQLYIDKKLSE